MKKVLYVILAFVALVIAALEVFFSDRVSESFKDYEAMKRSGIFESGWLPSYLPKSARDIQESHDIDTNYVEASFQFDVGDTASIEANCKLASKTNEVATYVCGIYEIKLFAGGKGELRSKYR